MIAIMYVVLVVTPYGDLPMSCIGIFSSYEEAKMFARREMAELCFDEDVDGSIIEEHESPPMLVLEHVDLDEKFAVNHAAFYGGE